jgi:hypothetical protein
VGGGAVHGGLGGADGPAGRGPRPCRTSAPTGLRGAAAYRAGGPRRGRSWPGSDQHAG